MEDFSICYKHDQCIKLLNKLIKRLKVLDIEDKIVYTTISEIKEYIKSSKKSGKCMERRLQYYYDSIVSLGFTRNKKKK